MHNILIKCVLSMSTSVTNANEISHFERSVRTFLAYSFLEEKQLSE
jgi:hypothetical protein